MYYLGGLARTVNFGKIELDGEEISNLKPVDIVGIIEQKDRTLGCTQDGRQFNIIKFCEEDQEKLQELLEQAKCGLPYAAKFSETVEGICHRREIEIVRIEEEFCYSNDEGFRKIGISCFDENSQKALREIYKRLEVRINK